MFAVGKLDPFATPEAKSIAAAGAAASFAKDAGKASPEQLESAQIAVTTVLDGINTTKQLEVNHMAAAMGKVIASEDITAQDAADKARKITLKYAKSIYSDPSAAIAAVGAAGASISIATGAFPSSGERLEFKAIEAGKEAAAAANSSGESVKAQVAAAAEAAAHKAIDEDLELDKVFDVSTMAATETATASGVPAKEQVTYVASAVAKEVVEHGSSLEVQGKVDEVSDATVQAAKSAGLTGNEAATTAKSVLGDVVSRDLNLGDTDEVKAALAKAEGSIMAATGGSAIAAEKQASGGAKMSIDDTEKKESGGIPILVWILLVPALLALCACGYLMFAQGSSKDKKKKKIATRDIEAAPLLKQEAPAVAGGSGSIAQGVVMSQAARSIALPQGSPVAGNMMPPTYSVASPMMVQSVAQPMVMTGQPVMMAPGQSTISRGIPMGGASVVSQGPAMAVGAPVPMGFGGQQAAMDLFNSLDTNHDGQLSPEEFAALQRQQPY